MKDEQALRAEDASSKESSEHRSDHCSDDHSEHSEARDPSPVAPQASGEGLLADVVRRSVRPPGEVTLGRFIGFGPDNQALVTYPQSPCRGPLSARSTLPLSSADFDREVALLFEAGDPQRPIIMGLMRSPVEAASEPTPMSGSETPDASARVDGERVVFNAEQEIVLRCGQASITLTRAGKIILRGK